jgi:hypothetical protein
LARGGSPAWAAPPHAGPHQPASSNLQKRSGIAARAVARATKRSPSSSWSPCRVGAGLLHQVRAARPRAARRALRRASGAAYASRRCARPLVLVVRGGAAPPRAKKRAAARRVEGGGGGGTHLVPVCAALRRERRPARPRPAAAARAPFGPPAHGLGQGRGRCSGPGPRYCLPHRTPAFVLQKSRISVLSSNTGYPRFAQQV